MKKFIYTPIIIFFLFLFHDLPAQSAAGRWEGKLAVANTQLRLVFHIEQQESGLKATLDSPDQGARGIVVDSVRQKADSLFLYLPRMGASYAGRLDAGRQELNGTWQQGGMSLPLVMLREETEAAPERPQHPTEPFPYHTEDISFSNQEAGIKLAATFSRPSGEGQYPAVILVSGSGPQDRDETILDHKPFLVLADYLTRRGLAVLRYDDRGFGQSGGNFTTATTADFAGDAAAAFDYLQNRRDVKANQIGMIGHSEGGIIAPLVARKGKPLAFAVLMAGPAIPGHELILQQGMAIMEQQGADEAQLTQYQQQQGRLLEVVKNEADLQKAAKELQNILTAAYDSLPAENRQEQAIAPSQLQAQVAQLLSPWFRYFIAHDPAEALVTLNTPTLALYGGKDLQVPAAANAEAMKKIKDEQNKDNIHIEVLPDLNHLFQPAKTGLPQEYRQIETTLAPEAMEKISEWIWQQLPGPTE